MLPYSVPELVYWPGLPGCGEFVRLVFEHLRVAFRDTRDAASVARVKQESSDTFAPPFLLLNGKVFNQTAAIAAQLWELHRPNETVNKFVLLQSALFIMDVVKEVHDTHHPISTGLYYEDQKTEAVLASKNFFKVRVPVLLGFLLRQLGDKKYLFDDSAPRYPDLFLFQLIRGLQHAFPNRTRAIEKDYLALFQLADRIGNEDEGIRLYCASERRQPFTLHGIFRHYPELDILE